MDGEIVTVSDTAFFHLIGLMRARTPTLLESTIGNHQSIGKTSGFEELLEWQS
jgi:hypothetical protein